MLPAFTSYKVFERIAERLAETLFRMQRVRERKRAKEIPFPLQIYLFGQAHLSANFVSLFTLVVPLDVFFPLLLVGDSFLHSLPHIGFALFAWKLLALLVGGFKLFFLFDLFRRWRNGCPSSLVPLRKIFLRGGDVMAPVK